LWSVLIFYCVGRSRWNSNLNWIQISLEIIKRFEKEKNFHNSYLVMGWNPAGNQVRPSQPLLSPPPFLFFTRPSRVSPAWLHFRVGPPSSSSGRPSHHHLSWRAAAPCATVCRPPMLGWRWTEVPPSHLHPPALAQCLVDSSPWFNVKTVELKIHRRLTHSPPLHRLPEAIKDTYRIMAPHHNSCHSLFHFSVPPLVPHRALPLNPNPLRRRRNLATALPDFGLGELRAVALSLPAPPRWALVPRSAARW
jgi:hypothetical protein